MKLSIVEVRRMIRDVLAEGVTVQFRPGEVKDWLTTAIEMSGGRYEYNPKGSRVSFSGNQFSEFVEFLNDALSNTELVDDEDKQNIQSTLDHVMHQLGQG